MLRNGLVVKLLLKRLLAFRFNSARVSRRVSLNTMSLWRRCIVVLTVRMKVAGALHKQSSREGTEDDIVVLPLFFRGMFGKINWISTIPAICILSSTHFCTDISF